MALALLVTLVVAAPLSAARVLHLAVGHASAATVTVDHFDEDDVDHHGNDEHQFLDTAITPVPQQRSQSIGDAPPALDKPISVLHTVPDTLALPCARRPSIAPTTAVLRL
ncbi:hypothetical protein GCM10027610_059650 [Dactylosporangium cerinum]